jgi:hypothetical protein
MKNPSCPYCFGIGFFGPLVLFEGASCPSLQRISPIRRACRTARWHVYVNILNVD